MGILLDLFILMNGVVFLNYYIVIDHNKWRFMVIKRDIRVYIYIYISYGMYDQHICKSYTYDGLGVSENVYYRFHILLSLNKFTYTYTFICNIYIYTYI